MMDTRSSQPEDERYTKKAFRTRNIPSCVACHGPNAEGAAAQGAGQIPRLGGLSYYYLKKRLEQWGEGYHATALPPMPEIATKLSENDIEALASYLSFVK